MHYNTIQLEGVEECPYEVIPCLLTLTPLVYGWCTTTQGCNASILIPYLTAGPGSWVADRPGSIKIRLTSSSPVALLFWNGSARQG